VAETRRAYHRNIDAMRLLKRGLILGFAAYSETQIADAVRTLAGVLSDAACSL
jgi:hypothetical protein